MAPNLTNTLLLITFLVVLLPVETYAFGAGDIPDFAYLNDKAFRHGDIENILETLAKSAGGAAVGSGLFGKFASSLIDRVKGGSNFSKSDIKKANLILKAMDIAGLSKLTADTLVLVVSVLGFMTFGFASEEYEVTADRLGVYLPVEHIDNPKGYAEAEGDARQFHPKLRPPVDPRELEIDENTGMKKYIATENQGWDTSTAFIRRTLEACIEYGRRSGGEEGPDLWEAYRLLGTGLHTLEDLLAHSNWCELALRKMGHSNIFCHVGDNVIIETPNGPAPPLVTGTFGSADFLHSLLGEAGDKLSQASVTDLSAKINNSSQEDIGPKIETIKKIIGMFGGGEDDKINQGEEIKQQAKAYDFDPDNIAPPEVQKQLLDLLKWHDDIMRDITKKIEMVPGLSNMLEELSNAMNEYVYTVLAPYIGPILSQATSVLDEGSKAVIDNEDQYEVFDNPDAHDPSHSLLSKDHFGLILNEPAGKIAQIVVENSVNLIVQAWSNDENPNRTIDKILEAFHHPYYATGRSEIQNRMFDHMERWIGELGDDADIILDSLTKESVRDHKNKRPGLNDTEEAGYGGCGHGSAPSRRPSYQVSEESETQEYSSRDYGSRSYGEPTYGGGNYERPDYGDASEYQEGGGYQSQYRVDHFLEGYAPSYDAPPSGYESGYGGDDTFGAENLNISEDRYRRSDDDNGEYYE
uniref:Heterokaryon incompatibility Het-C n=1 Tax=Psilocybe cubensis TaxID=181762 RepID=A0A8H7XZN1_PSICU